VAAPPRSSSGWRRSVSTPASSPSTAPASSTARTPIGGCLLRVQCFEVASDGKRVILADGSGFARTAPRYFEVTTLPPEPWLSEWIVGATGTTVADAERLEQLRRSVEGQEGRTAE
jgi:hypothetical protein